MHHYKHYLLGTLSFIFGLSHSVLSNAETIEDGRIWLNINAVGALPMQGWHWYAELQPRLREEGEQLDQLLIRPAIYFDLSPKASIWFGYAHVTTHPSGRASFEENRLWQQFLYNAEPINQVTIQSRTRLEERFIEHADDTGYKLRQLVRITAPSGIDTRLKLVAYDEYFVNLNQTDYGARRGFDQNRAFIGVNWAFDTQYKIEVGYLNQWVNGKNTDLQNHVLSTTLNLNF